MASIDRATMAKNDAIAAENKLRTVQFEAQQAAENAKGIADAAIESARGQAQSVRLNAQANKDATVLAAEARKQQLVLEGDGLKANLAAQIEPFGGSDKYVDYLHAKAALNWNGATPQIVSGSSGGPNLIIPVPSAARGQ
jgi:regulator of protease activity HflC (stomatin/prohibitin superfamily)